MGDLIEPAFRRAQEKAWVAGIAEGRAQAFREAAEVARAKAWYFAGYPPCHDYGRGAEAVAEAIDAKAKEKP